MMYDLLRKTFRCLEWIPDYDFSRFRGDVMGGLTTGVMLIPQGMAYAVIAGLPPIYGLYAGVVPLLIYPLMGTSRQLAIGPVAIDMLIVAAGLSVFSGVDMSRFLVLAIVLTGMTGLIQIAMGAARLGFVVNFLSRPVITGFTFAAPIIISFSQLGNLLGVDLADSQFFYVLLQDAWLHLDQVHLETLIIGISGIVLIKLIRTWRPVFPASIIVVVLGIAAALMFDLEADGVELVGTIPMGLPDFTFKLVSFDEFRRLLPTAITLALVQFMGVASLGRMFAARHHYTIDANQELIALGTSNFLGSLFQSAPVSGSFSRSAANDQAGAKTPLANWITAGLVILTLLFLTPLFYNLPQPILAAIIIAAALGLIDIDELRYLYTTKRRDGLIALFTFVTTLVIGIQEGILLGIGASMIAILYRSSRPNVAELGHLPGTRSFRNVQRYPEAETFEHILILRVDASFSFANAEYFKDFILAKSEAENKATHVVIIEGSSINDLDTTAVESLTSVIKTLRKWNIDLYFTGLKGPVRDVVLSSGLKLMLGGDHFHRSPHRAISHILQKWDESDGENRLEAYMERTK